MRHLTAALAATLSLFTLLLALGSALPAEAQGTTPSRTLDLEAGERGPQYFFAPATITVPTGQVTVTMRNSGARPHNFSVEALNLKIPDVAGGKSAEATLNFTTPGTYDFICDLPGHADRGAKGTITVVAAPAAGAVAQATTAGAVAQATTAGAVAQATTAGAVAQATTVGQPTVRPATPAATTVSSTSSSSRSVTSTAPTTANAAARNVPLLISLAIHIPSAITWLGLALYDVIVVAVPFLTPAQKGGLLYRPRWAVVALIPLITVTGIYQTINNPFSTLTDFDSLERLRTTTTYGFALFLKHGFVMASLVLSLALTFWVAPRLVALSQDTAVPATVGLAARLPRLIAWGNILACAALVLCVTVMVFQLH